MNSYIRKIMTVISMIVVCALSVIGGTTNVQAQVPRLEVYFNEALNWDQTCPWADPYHPGPDYPFTLYFATVGLNMWMSAIEFSVSYPGNVTWLGDVPTTDIFIGSSPNGISLAWNPPVNAFGPAIVMKANIIYHATKYQSNIQVTVEPNPNSGFLRAVRWPEQVTVDLDGGKVTFCGAVPVENTTWGRVKALYN